MKIWLFTPFFIIRLTWLQLSGNFWNWEFRNGGRGGGPQVLSCEKRFLLIGRSLSSTAWNWGQKQMAANEGSSYNYDEPVTPETKVKTLIGYLPQCAALWSRVLSIVSRETMREREIRTLRSTCCWLTPSVWGPCPATGVVHLGEPRSSMGWQWSAGAGTPPPTPSRSSFERCTSWSAGRPPRSRHWRIASAGQRTPGC